MEIKGYDVTSISELKIDPDVVTLCITDCPVVDFAGLSALKELEYLSLTNTKIQSLGDIPELDNLGSLSIIDCPLIKNWDGLPYLPCLIHFSIIGSEIQTFEGLNPEKMPKLIRFAIGKSKVSSFKGLPIFPLLNVFQSWPASKEYALTLFEHFPMFPELEQILLGDNKFTSFVHFPQLLKLSILYLNRNKLSSFEGLPHYDHLNTLNLDDNEFTSLRGLPLKTCDHLGFNNNKIRTIQDADPSLRFSRLDLAHNPIPHEEKSPWPLRQDIHFPCIVNAVITFINPNPAAHRKVNLNK